MNVISPTRKWMMNNYNKNSNIFKNTCAYKDILTKKQVVRKLAKCIQIEHV